MNSDALMNSNPQVGWETPDRKIDLSDNAGLLGIQEASDKGGSACQPLLLFTNLRLQGNAPVDGIFHHKNILYLPYKTQNSCVQSLVP